MGALQSPFFIHGANMDNSIWIGYDPREVAAFAVARWSINHYLNTPIPVRGVILDDLRNEGLYKRETTLDDAGRLFDVISNHQMSTEFAISRFLVPELVRRKPRHRPATDRWALFVDADVMARGDIEGLFRYADPSKAVYVVKHDFVPKEGLKMDGQVQSAYSRKNWSSVMLFNVDHPANQKLTPELVNSVPGRDLHAFCWLDDKDIGELPPVWNYLVGFHNKNWVKSPQIVHFTDGIPTMPGHEKCEYADEWHRALKNWAR